MSAADAADFHSDEPLSLWVEQQTTPEHFGEATCLGFEYSCRGDRVPGRLLLPPERTGPLPLVLVGHDFGGCKDTALRFGAALWLKAGLGVASIDLPLHGQRASAKLSQQLAGEPPNGDVAPGLWEEFFRQAVLDLRRSLSALGELADLDPNRVGYAGFGLGAAIGCLFCAADPRPRAAALAGAGPAPELCGFAPQEEIAAFAPRPLLLINTKQDDVLPRTAAEALYRAAGEPKQLEWCDATREDLAVRAAPRMGSFLEQHL